MRRALLLAAAAVAACSAPPIDAGLSPADQERVRYERALSDMVRGRSEEAEEAFSELMEGASNPEVAELSMLRMGDVLFAGGKFAEAREVYRQFVEQFGSSLNVPHALYMSARCHLERTPEDLWILPPAAEREQGDLRHALTLLKRLVLSHGDSFAAARGRALYALSVRRACEHELYVARYYLGRKRPVGTIQRLEQLLSEEEEQRTLGLLPAGWQMCGREDEGFLLLAQAYARDGGREGLERTLARYEALRPAGRALPAIRSLLEGLGPDGRPPR
ncbi:MAG: outer membrane protein assembly factor BamD [Deltaproteobacteria bacterium]|nr:outer membrane protein assembly factor BamD [Deltaproteobacteria bacterium]